MAKKRYSRIAILLNRYHSSWKAAEILLDAKRGDSQAVRWIRVLRTFGRQS